MRTDNDCKVSQFTSFVKTQLSLEMLFTEPSSKPQMTQTNADLRAEDGLICAL